MASVSFVAAQKRCVSRKRVAGKEGWISLRPQLTRSAPNGTSTGGNAASCVAAPRRTEGDTADAELDAALAVTWRAPSTTGTESLVAKSLAEPEAALELAPHMVPSASTGRNSSSSSLSALRRVGLRHASLAEDCRRVLRSCSWNLCSRLALAMAASRSRNAISRRRSALSSAVGG